MSYCSRSLAIYGELGALSRSIPLMTISAAHAARVLRREKERGLCHLFGIVEAPNRMLWFRLYSISCNSASVRTMVFQIGVQVGPDTGVLTGMPFGVTSDASAR